jgi:hypothetical protein
VVQQVISGDRHHRCGCIVLLTQSGGHPWNQWHLLGNCVEVVILPNGQVCNCFSNQLPLCTGIFGFCTQATKLYKCPGINATTGLPCAGVVNWNGCK